MTVTRASASEPPRVPVADALATLLVREGILPPSRVDEATERMVLSGGTLDTALLELGLIEEARLLDLLPRAYNARAVGRGELDSVDKNVTGLFPRRLAEKHGVVPLDVSGRRLTLAVAGPPDLSLLDEIGFMLSVYVKPAVTTQARIASALARLYGVPVPPRLEALLPRVGMDPAAARASVEAWQARTAHAHAPKPAAAAAPVSAPAVVDDARPAWAQTKAPDASGWRVEQNAGLSRGEASAPKLEAADGGSLEATAEAKAIAERRAAEPGDEQEEARRRTRVMWTVDDAIAELALADGRDGMLDVVMRFAYRRLTTVAAFVLVRGKDAQGNATQSFVGWDVIDPFLVKKDIAAFTLSADPAHALGQVLLMRSPFLGPLRREDPLVRLFGRNPRAVVLVPILVGDKLIGVLYGDCGSRSIPPSSLAELHMVVPRLGKGLGNLILRKKKALRVAAQPPPLGDVIVGAPIDDAIVLDTTELIEIDEVEEDLAVSAPAPSRNVPAIDIDLSDIMESAPADALPAAAPTSTEGQGQRQGQGPAEVTTAIEPRAMPWADGKDDDEDVRLDDSMWRELDAARATTTNTAPIELGLDEQLSGDSDDERNDGASTRANDLAAAKTDERDDDAKEDFDDAPRDAPRELLAQGHVAEALLMAEDRATSSQSDVAASPIEASPASMPSETSLGETRTSIESSPSETPTSTPIDASTSTKIEAPTAIEVDITSSPPVPAESLSTTSETSPSASAAASASAPAHAPASASASASADELPPRVPGFRVDSAEGAAVNDGDAASAKTDGSNGAAAFAGNEATDPGARATPEADRVAVSAEGAPAVMPPPVVAEPTALAPSPGARARETMLMATHAQWMAHEDPLLDDLVGQLHRPGESQRRAALAAVTAHGDRAMPSLARYFPGVLAVHPFGAMESRPEVAELSDCLACLMKLGADRAAPILVAELGHHDRLHRWAAVWALSGIHVAGALSRLAQRIFDAEPAIAALALEVIDGYRKEPAFEKVISQVRDLVRRGDPFERQRAIMAVGELKDREAMLALVELLGTRPKEIAEEARRALVDISKQDFGGAERRWKAWIADNEKTPRTRWLIDGLSSKDDEIRRSAQHELNRLTGQFFGYRWDAPRTDREQSIAAWEEWWSAQKDAPPGRWP